MDTTISVLILLVQLALGTLGVYVSMRPPRAEKHLQFIVAFSLLGVMGIVLTIAQGVRNSRAQERLTQELATIKNNTEHPPTVQNTINVPPAQIISGEEAEKAKRKAVREQLAQFISEADKLVNICAPQELVQTEVTIDRMNFCDGQKAKWERRVEDYLRTSHDLDADSSYITLFKRSEGYNTPGWDWRMNFAKQLGMEQEQLWEFLKGYQ